MSETATTRKRPAKKAAPSKPGRIIEELPEVPKPLAVPTYGDDKVTPATQWNSKVGPGMVIELPSGNFAKVRRTMNLPTLLASGQIPNPLADIIREMIESKSSQLNIAETDTKAMEQMVMLVDSQMPTIFVEPKVERCPDGWDTDKQGLWQPSEGALNVLEVDFEDKFYLFVWAQGAALDVARFRERAAQGMASLQHGEGVASDSGATDGGDG